MQYWVQSQKQQNDLGLFPRQIIQHHSNLSLHPNHSCQRSQSWPVLWSSIIGPRISTKKRYTFHYAGLECKSRKSTDSWSNRQVWPWSTKWNRAKANKVFPENTLVIANSLFQQLKRQLHTWISPDGQFWNQINYILCSRRWRSSIQSVKTRPGTDWLRSWASYCKNQA